MPKGDRLKLSEKAAFKRLPKWVQEEVKGLERKKEELMAEVLRMTRPRRPEHGELINADFDVVSDNWAVKGTPLGCERVGWQGCAMRVKRSADGVLLISTDNGQPLTIRPLVSNQIEVLILGEEGVQS